ncbi:MAG: LolA family protein [Thermodesulfobacteriota bacterium]
MTPSVSVKTLGSALLAAVVLLAAAPLWVQVPFCAAESESGSGEEVLERITEAFSGIVSIESEFIQESHTAMLEEPLRSSGLFRYEAPDFVRWEVLSPERAGFSADGDRLKTWKGSSNEKEGAPPGAEAGIRHFMEQLLAWVRADFDWLGERFDISVLKDSPVELVLEPMSEAVAERLDRIRVTFSQDLSHLKAIEIRETGGDRMVITFLNVRVTRR